MFELSGNDKLTKEDALESDQKFVDPFLCPICFYIVQEKNVQCNDCQQIFDDHCLKKWLEQNGSCPSCKSDRFNAQVMNRNLRNQLELVDFRCKSCAQVMQYSNRRGHSRECDSLLISGCPLSCGKFTQGSYENICEHLRAECTSRRLNCPACDFMIYRTYSDRAVITAKKGHNCLRDNRTSTLLIQNLMTMQKRLRLLDGDIPDECKPTQNDPFWIKRAENTT